MILKQLTLQDAAAISEFTMRFEPYSDFNFLSLYSWSSDNQTKFCLTAKALYVQMPNYTDGAPLYTLLCDATDTESAKIMVDWLDSHKNELSLQLLPATSATALAAYCEQQNISVNLEADRGNFDYILKTQQFADAHGPDYQDLRYKLSKLSRDWGTKLTPIDFDPKNDQHVAMAEQLTLTWAEHKKALNEPYAEEVTAFKQFLTAGSALQNVRFKAYVMEGKMVAFTSYEVVSKDYAVGHFLKYDPAIRNIYYRLVHDACVDLAKLGTPYINIEQDLDILNLRQAKMHLRPERLLQKFNATFN